MNPNRPPLPPQAPHPMPPGAPLPPPPGMMPPHPMGMGQPPMPAPPSGLGPADIPDITALVKGLMAIRAPLTALAGKIGGGGG